MSAVPQTHEEAFTAILRFIDHPRTRRVLMAQTPARKTQFVGGRLKGYVSEKLAANFSASLIEQMADILWVNAFFIAPMQDGTHVLCIFAESEVDHSKVRFGLWNAQEQTLREIEMHHISEELTKLQFIVKVLDYSSRGILSHSSLQVQYI